MQSSDSRRTTHDAPMTSPTPNPFPCPVCNDCDHDLRGGILEFINNVRENLTEAGEALLDACEATTDIQTKFGEAMTEVASVRQQLSVLLDTIPDIALIKAVHTQ